MVMTSSQMTMTGERFLPQLDGVIRLEHLHRYFIACELVDGRDVLDLACGEGYGSALMSRRAKSVIGVDIAADAITHARQNYTAPNLSFLEGSATTVPLSDASVDLVVSFETIEHLTDHEAMLADIRRVLRPEGILLLSSPNKKIYSDESGYQNPFHQKELYTSELIALVARYFPNLRHYGQKIVAGSVLNASAFATPLIILSESGRDDGLEQRRYDLVLAALAELPDLPNSVFEVTDSLLDPYKAEEFIAHHNREQEKILNANTNLRVEYDRIAVALSQLTVEYGKLLKRCDALTSVATEKTKAMEEALARIARDANVVVESKHWKRTEFYRKLSNSMRKYRGKPKKVWPKSFTPERYLPAPSVASEAEPEPAPAQVKRLDLIPFHGRNLEPHLTCVSMVRNESKRADDMMRHLCALFDRVVVVDHLSTDGTAEIVARYDGHATTEVVILKGSDAGYYQSEYMTAVARALLAEQRSDWIFFLDFDEILPFRSREIFLQALVPLTGADVIHSHWYNLALEGGPADSFQCAQVTIGPKASPFTKVALNVPRLKDRKVTVRQGNHAVTVDGGEAPYLGERAFGVFHLPINGKAAFRAKLEQGIRAYDQTEGHTAGEGVHWRELLPEVNRIAQDPVLLREVALRYGEPLTEVLADVEAGQLTPDTRPMTLNFAQTAPAPADAGASMQAPEFDLATINAVMGLAFKPSETTSADPLAGFSKPLYEMLAPRTERLDPTPLAQVSRIQNAMISAATELEVVALPTAWSGHKAFLFSLMEATRPRRYVELGTHAGASFFAACQHIKMNRAYGEAVAVDIWEGDHQAGFYDEHVFNKFKYTLNKHFPKIGFYIRGYFSQAVNLFEPGSIELLHIDGLHTYSAVKEDYETWRGVLSENGTIIFHDTSEYQTDFGVWQLFEEIEGAATASFRFRHCHGLGVLAFGDREINPAIEFLEHLAADPARAESYYATLGSALFEQALRRVL